MKKHVIALSMLMLTSNLAFGRIGFGFDVKNESSKKIYVIAEGDLMGKHCTKVGTITIKPGKTTGFTTTSGTRAIQWCYEPKKIPTGWSPKEADWYQSIHTKKPHKFTITGDKGQYDYEEKKGLGKTERKKGNYGHLLKFVPQEIVGKYPNIPMALDILIKDIKEGRMKVEQIEKGKQKKIKKGTLKGVKIPLTEDVYKIVPAK